MKGSTFLGQGAAPLAVGARGRAAEALWGWPYSTLGLMFGYAQALAVLGAVDQDGAPRCGATLLFDCSINNNKSSTQRMAVRKNKITS